MNIKIDANLLEQASELQQLDCCPLCSGKHFHKGWQDNDLTAMEDMPEALKSSGFRLCLDCGAVYAAKRQIPEVMRPYYELFPVLEHRTYNSYPPPEGYKIGKMGVADWLVGLCQKYGNLTDQAEILHVRSDFGSLGQALKKAGIKANVTGLDYMASNVRYSNETQAVAADILLPGPLRVIENRQFDIVIINHIFTHSINPRADMETCLKMLKPGGVIINYNENDFSSFMRPSSKYFRLAPVNNYHKQLFTNQSLTRFYNSNGLDVEHISSRKHTLTVVARRSDVAVVAISDHEQNSLTAMLDRWLRLRRSPVRFMMAIKPLRKLRRALARIAFK